MNIISRKEAKAKNLTRYYTGEPCKYGHVDERRVSNSDCMSCRRKRYKTYASKNQEKVKARAKKYRENNKDKIQEYYDKNKNRIAKLKREYQVENAQKIKEYQREWTKNNREYIRGYVNEKNKNDPIRKISNHSRSMIYRIMKSTGGKKVNNTSDIVGYTSKELKEYLESLFLDGMTWENHGEWHIDHIVPVSWWLKNGVTDPTMVNDLLNLQPLWAKDNLAKSDKLI
ncbi:MAG: hypothetical protein Tp118SUR00d2C21406351_48 [Prokaryotic dsDNA virus sp.]|nr:MAG: hypothetical protein Tp118SUR00d2C21406351_48 [Prokaryotic dsDNA virus sp.]|tara:strand:- start:1838 stop:2521 length:684 start_codon:yes stop_codon:yes gene_type:complete